MEKGKKVKPALYRFGGLDWAWVLLSELAKVVAGITGEPLGQGQLLQRFISLSKDPESLPMVLVRKSPPFHPCKIGMMTAYIENREDKNNNPSPVLCFLEMDCEIQLQEMDRFDESDFQLFVPAGFSAVVLDVVEAGVARVVPVEHRHLSDADECPVGTFFCVFNGGPNPDEAFTAAVCLDKSGNPVVI